ncbi:MAG: hypothetical protein ACK5TX_17480 [Planctomyces sp.]
MSIAIFLCLKQKGDITGIVERLFNAIDREAPDELYAGVDHRRDELGMTFETVLVTRSIDSTSS